MPRHVDQIGAPLEIEILHICLLADLESRVDKNLQETQCRYKLDYGKKVRFEKTFVRGDSVFVERPFLATTAAEQLALEKYSKLCHGYLGP